TWCSPGLTRRGQSSSPTGSPLTTIRTRFPLPVGKRQRTSKVPFSPFIAATSRGASTSRCRTNKEDSFLASVWPRWCREGADGDTQSAPFTLVVLPFRTGTITGGRHQPPRSCPCRTPHRPPSLELIRQIKRQADRFDAGLRAGSPPDLDVLFGE